MQFVDIILSKFDNKLPLFRSSSAHWQPLPHRGCITLNTTSSYVTVSYITSKLYLLSFKGGYLRDTQSSSSIEDWSTNSTAESSSFFDHISRHDVTRTAIAHGSPRRIFLRQPTTTMTTTITTRYLGRIPRAHLRRTATGSRGRRIRRKNEHFRIDKL